MKNILIPVMLLIMANAVQLNAQEITMFPGLFGATYYQDDQRITRGQVETLMLKNPEANRLWKKSKQQLTIGWIAFGAEVGFLIWQLNRASNNESQIVPLVGVIATAGVAIGYSLAAGTSRKRAILKYNQTAETTSVTLGATYNGLGLVYSF